MENITFNYLGLPVTVGYGKRIMPHIIIPDQKSGLNRKISVSELKIGFTGAMRAVITDNLLDTEGGVVPTARKGRSEETMPYDDYDYYYDIEVNAQKYGNFTEKQLINRILKEALNINCFNHLGEFLAPISFTHEVDATGIHINLVDHDDSIDKEYSFDGGVTWQNENTLSSPEEGSYSLAVRYKNKELRQGRSFRSTQNTIIELL